jgi:hypothetical protein
MELPNVQYSVHKSPLTGPYFDTTESTEHCHTLAESHFNIFLYTFSFPNGFSIYRLKDYMQLSTTLRDQIQEAYQETESCCN